ncbi:MAG: hypothetical protein C0425_10530 [Chlorobiaceae bacterium]|nr:hypothetical protein [Chlorobiaceae bacterium]MBA4310753.1 hypothetical protein [Chlorobiaceae bacterium]
MKLNNLKPFFLVLTFLFATININSQEKLTLTVEQAVEIGLAKNKTLKISEMRVKSALARSKEIFTQRLPSLNLSASYTRLSELDPFILATPFGNFDISPVLLNSYQSKLTLSQPLFTGFKLSSTIDMLDYLAEAESEDFNVNKSELAFNIKTAYWNYYKATQMKKVLDETVEQVKSRLNDAKNLLEQGMITRNDLLKLEVQLSDVLFKQVDVKNGVRLAQISLNNIMGIPLSTELELNAQVEIAKSEILDLNELLATANQNRGELKSADLKIKASESNVTATRSSWYPQFMLQGNYNYSRPNQRVFPTEDKFKATWDISVGMSFDIWNWFRTSHQTDQAEAQLNQSKDAHSLLSDGIILEVTNNFLNLNQAKEKIEISELGVKQADENLRVTAEKFKNGLALSSDLIDAEVALLSAKTNFNNAIVDYKLANEKLNKSIGK